MKSKNILANIQSKSIKEAKDEINSILDRLEKNDVDLGASIDDYQKLIKLNNLVDRLFKDKVRTISALNKKNKKNISK
jgi:exonuclease VII small subunit